MTTPASGQISMDDVKAEVGFGNPVKMSDLYGLALVQGAGGLMYHNLNMSPGNATTAKVAIYDPNNANQNRSLDNWYNYDQTPNIVLNFDVINQVGTGDIIFELYIVDPDTAPPTFIQFNPPYTGNLAPAGGNVSETNFDTGVPVASIVQGYKIGVEAAYAPNPPPPPTPAVAITADVFGAASDTDGVGPGTFRRGLGPTFDTDTPLPQTIIVDGNTPSGRTEILINKRTTFTLTFV
jgi:hypothetical protein